MGESDRHQVRSEMPIRASWQCGLSPKPWNKALPSPVSRKQEFSKANSTDKG